MSDRNTPAAESPVTFGMLSNFASMLGEKTRAAIDAILAPFAARLNEIESRTDEGVIAKALDPFGQRLSRLELIVGTMAMQRGAPAEGAVNVADLVESLQARIVALEARPEIHYRGVWAEGEYCEGDFVTHAGSCWHCNERTKSKPGDGAAWQLAVKRGADGKSAR
jgi:hypothetical protein